MGVVNHDKHRENRTGIPEVILAEPKSIGDVISAIEIAMEKNGRALITRIQENQIEGILEIQANNKEWNFKFDDFKRTLIVFKENPNLKGDLSVGILSAGTSDRYLVEEISFCLDFFGWSSEKYIDVGVAGLHRFRGALDIIEGNSKIKCLIVVAGQDGALFPVISGQTKLPVIAVPTSIGYGFGGKGETALMTALQSCAPGISVVNIDNGFGAASMAAKILNLF